MLMSAMNSKSKGKTENGADTFTTTANANLDYFARAAAMRGSDTTGLFRAALTEDRNLALRNLFYLRDIRQGKGERKAFRDALAWLYANNKPVFNRIVRFVPEYGRWDDILEYVDSVEVQHIVSAQLLNDQHEKNPSLLGKWMPSENASSKSTQALARRWMAVLNMSARQYRKMLSELRQKINVVERQMSAQDWSEINYERVPSVASKNYRKAFGKHDQTRYAAYLAAVEKGTAKINAGVLFPYEIYRSYAGSYGHDATLEAQWRALPNYITEDMSFLVMADVSGSMTSNDGMPMAMSVSLAIYAAERLKGKFAGHYMTFSDAPVLIKIKGTTLRDKMYQVQHEHIGYNTNLQAGFERLLKTAVEWKVPQSEMPSAILVISDMEFDNANIGGRSFETNFMAIKRKYDAAGYPMPRLVFWNVNSRKNNVAARGNDANAVLVSGASATIFKSALALKDMTVTPMDIMKETLMVPRYDFVEELW